MQRPRFLDRSMLKKTRHCGDGANMRILRLFVNGLSLTVLFATLNMFILLLCRVQPGESSNHPAMKL